MGVQRIDPSKWKIEVTGLVNTPLTFSYEEFLQLPMIGYAKTFNCVTSWSIEKPQWEGVSIKYLADRAQVKPEAKWVMFHCYDGYTAPIPVEDALRDDSIVALKMNGKPLSPEQGFPARPFMPHLYAWKSAKWLGEIEFIPEYVDGYWERYGYHERGDVYEEERFKGSAGGKHYARRAFGTA
ncbi:MAG: molybdopterin-dependent oxidoreductase [Thaumarchaeota archaeon]|nr:molybdopterin-dependent oxidoreductase [Nitrososphaerota archaeon]